MCVYVHLMQSQVRQVRPVFFLYYFYVLQAYIDLAKLFCSRKLIYLWFTKLTSFTLIRSAAIRSRVVARERKYEHE